MKLSEFINRALSEIDDTELKKDGVIHFDVAVYPSGKNLSVDTSDSNSRISFGVKLTPKKLNKHTRISEGDL